MVHGGARFQMFTEPSPVWQIMQGVENTVLSAIGLQIHKPQRLPGLGRPATLCQFGGYVDFAARLDHQAKAICLSLTAL